MMLRAQRRVAMFLPSLAGGGAERVVLNLAAGLAARGFPVDLVLAAAEGAYLPLVPSDVRIVDLKAPRVLRSPAPWFPKGKRPGCIARTASSPRALSG